jgi:ankyrin repeat protein
VESLPKSDHLLLNEAAGAGRASTVRACIAAGFPVTVASEGGATALHVAAINGYTEIVEALLTAGADTTVRDSEHHSTPMGWAMFGADLVANRDGDYEETVRALVVGGAVVHTDEHVSTRPEIRAAAGLP